MQTLKRFFPALIVAVAATAARAYMPCPEGLFRCGQLKEPPKADASKVLSWCDAGKYQRTSRNVSLWQTKVAQLLGDERKMAASLSSLADAYTTYPQKAKYLRGVSKAINEGLIGVWIEPLKSDLDRAKSCFDSNKADSGGCHNLPVNSCADPQILEEGLPQLRDYVREVGEDLSWHSSKLAFDLPHAGVMKKGRPVTCGPKVPPCQQHMKASMKTVLEAQALIQKNDLP